MCYGESMECGSGWGSMMGKKKMGMAGMGMSYHHPMMGMGHHMGMCPMCQEAGLSGNGKMHKWPIMMAKHAKKELLYERIKSRIDQKYGDKLDRVADEVVEITDQKMLMKIELIKKKMEMKSRIWEMMAELLEEESGEGEGMMQEPPPQEEWQEG